MGKDVVDSFGEEGARILLKSVVSFRSEADKNIEGLGWCENGRRYSLEMRKMSMGVFFSTRPQI